VIGSRLAGAVAVGLLALSIGWPESAVAQPSGGKDSAQVMRELRVTFLSASAASLGFRPSRDYPRVLGVALDWPVGEQTGTIVSALDGSASLYTTATFGIIGGDAHEPVRAAARRFVKAAESHHDEAVPTDTYPYPAPGKVRFYLRTFEGVRVIESDAASVYSSTGRHSALFRVGQGVLTELRKVTEQKR
jgi:hypothetical protein